jgi:hypothetical protein
VGNQWLVGATAQVTPRQSVQRGEGPEGVGLTGGHMEKQT